MNGIDRGYDNHITACSACRENIECKRALILKRRQERKHAANQQDALRAARRVIGFVDVMPKPTS
jgi:hypothetical protein